MLPYAKFDLGVVAPKVLACLTLIIADSKASPIPRRIGARGTGITSPDENLMTVKNILEWVFAAAAVIVVCSIFMWRIRFLRARNRPLQDFFTFIEAPRQIDSSPWSIRSNPRAQDRRLSRTPTGGQRRGRTRAADTDRDGRRGGGPDPDDANGDATEKDALPPYEVKGGPPNYGQFLAVDTRISANARPRIAETLSETTNPLTQPCPAPDTQPELPHPPPPSYNPVTPPTNP